MCVSLLNSLKSSQHLCAKTKTSRLTDSEVPVQIQNSSTNLFISELWCHKNYFQNIFFLSTSFAIIRQVADSIDFYFDDCIHVSLYLYQNLIDSNILQASLYTLAGACSSELGIIFYICVYEYLCLYVLLCILKQIYRLLNYVSL